MNPDVSRHRTVVRLPSLTCCLGWFLAALSARAQVQIEASGPAGRSVDPGPTAGAVHVYLENAVEPVLASADAPNWIDGARVVSIERTYGASDPIVPVEAVGGGKRWSFHVDRAKRWAALPVTDEIREAWEVEGKLEISCEGSRLLEIRSRPRRLALGPDGEEFTAMQRGSVLVPGSRDWVEVLAGEIMWGQARLGVYTVEGETLAGARKVGVGEEVTFRIGEEEYGIEVGLLQGGVIGEHSAKLRVKRCDGTPRPEQALRTALIALLQQELARGGRKIAEARRLLDDGDVAKERLVLETARRIHQDVRRAQLWIEELAPRLVKGAPWLSLVKARVVRPPPPDGFFADPGPPEAMVLDVYVVGRAHEPWTIRGRQRPFAKRMDLASGESVKLSFHGTDPRFWADVAGEDAVYWLLIGTSMATDGTPRLMGYPGRSDVVFAMPIREP
jgi:hypothetical protein